MEKHFFNLAAIIAAEKDERKKKQLTSLYNALLKDIKLLDEYNNFLSSTISEAALEQVIEAVIKKFGIEVVFIYDRIIDLFAEHNKLLSIYNFTNEKQYMNEAISIIENKIKPLQAKRRGFIEIIYNLQQSFKH